MLQDELKCGKEAVDVDVEGYSVHTPEPPADWLGALPLLSLPAYGGPVKPQVTACFDCLQL